MGALGGNRSHGVCRRGASRVSNGHAHRLIDSGGHYPLPQRLPETAAAKGVLGLRSHQRGRLGAGVSPQLGEAHAAGQAAYPVPEVGSALPGQLAPHLCNEATSTPRK